MFLDAWSLALTLLGVISVALVTMSCKTAVRVLRFWNPASDDNLQITLENETWLVSTIIEYALGFQILSLILFVFAADHYAQLIIGAMCATGALLANDYGIWALMLKILGLFLYGYWIILHRLDISSERYPLIRHKYAYLLALVPLIIGDMVLQSQYILHLRPDIITSCCGVVFGDKGENPVHLLLAGLGSRGTDILFYLVAALLLCLAMAIIKWNRFALSIPYAFMWFLFFLLSLHALTFVFSSYIYALPSHRCPLCIIKREYHCIGLLLYGFLFTGTFAGTATAVAGIFHNHQDLQMEIRRLQLLLTKVSIAFLLLFTTFSSYHYAMYYIMGGE